MKLFKHSLFVLGATMALLVSVTGCYAQPAVNVNWSKAIYVLPTGNDSAAGTREKPFATVQKAVSALPDSGGGTIALLGGTYKEDVRLGASAGEGEAAPLTLTAVPGEKVLLQGGEPITKWTSYNDEKGMYVVEAPDRQSMHSRTGYLDVWENTARVRYRSQFDADGVRAYPGSACLLDDKRILVHTRDGRTPKEVDLWRNRQANGMTIGRDNVTVHGLQFENYLGGTAARAITIRGNSTPDYKNVVITDCVIRNCVRGMSITADAPRIVNCDIREVGLGVAAFGKNTHVENCAIQSASGNFAIADLNQHARDGIRLYYPANGATIINNVTTGFWTGVYVKSYTDKDNALPMLIKNNIILDGIFPGIGAPQAKNSYLANIIGPNEQFLDPMKHRFLLVADVESNYSFNRGGSARGTNVVGEDPFVDLVNGDLSIKPNAKLPVPIIKGIGEKKQVQWSAALSQRLKNIYQPKTVDTNGVLRFTKQPVAASSKEGAIISARFSEPAQGTLRYRKVGQTTWRKTKGIDNTLTQPDVIMGAAPASTDAHENDYGVLFPLLGSTLEGDSDYEFIVDVTAKGSSAIHSQQLTSRTTGGPKEIFVGAGSDADSADGSADHPFAQLQAAFDHALPGDTIRLEKDVYTESALLVHGDTSQLPITIAGAGATNTILDGGRIAPVLLELRDTDNIIIRDFQVRWFGNAGIHASKTTNVTVERCHFFNAALRGAQSPNGSGIVLRDSPQWTISHCLFAKMEHGVSAARSPELKLLNNTAFGNLYDGVSLSHSMQGSVVAGNSFNFTGNDSMTISEPNKDALSSFTCDNNNYGTSIRSSEKVRPENDFEPAARYGYAGGSKAMIRFVLDGTMHRLNRLDEWREFSGKDAHSIFADPQFVDPLNVDFRLLPDSPNVLPDGRILGALPVKKG